jgi:hypothetical protein
MNPTIYAWMGFYFYDPPDESTSGAAGARFNGQPACPDVYNPPAGATSRPDLLAVVVLDLEDRRTVDLAFAQLAERLLEAEREAAPRCEGVMYSILAFGVEPDDRRAEQTHEAYNRMWTSHPYLWETIQGRELPICLWLVDGQGRPFHGIIQPAWNRDFEIWTSSDSRKTERYELYRAQGGPWSAMLMPLGADVIGRAQAHVRSTRAGPGAAADRPRK